MLTIRFLGWLGNRLRNFSWSWNQKSPSGTKRSKAKISRLDNKKLDDLSSVITSLKTYQPQIPQVPEGSVDSIISKIEDIQFFQQLLDVLTDSDKANSCLNRGITYYNQQKYDRAINVFSQALRYKEDWEKAYLYRKACLDSLSLTERKKSLVAIATTTNNLQLCGLQDTDIDDIVAALMTYNEEPLSLNFCYNFPSDKIMESLLFLAEKNPYITNIEHHNIIINGTVQKLHTTLQENQQWYSIENENRSNKDYFITHREGKNLLQKGDIHQALRCFMKALNYNLHNPTGIESLISTLHKQQRTLACHEKAVTGILSLSPSEFITASLDGTLCKWVVEESWELFSWKQIKPQEITSVMNLNDDHIITGHSNGMIIIWDLINTTPFQVIEKGHTKAIEYLLRISDTQFISYDSLTLKYWSIQQKSVVKLVNLVASTVASTSTNNLKKEQKSFSQCNSNKCLKTINEKRATAFGSYSDGILVFGDTKGILRFIDIRYSDKIYDEIDTNYSNSPITAIKELKKGKFIIGYEDGFLQILDSVTKKLDSINTARDPQRSINALAVLDDTYWLSGSKDGQVLLWDENNTCFTRFEANSAVTSLCVDSVGLVYIGCEDGTLHKWKPPLKTIVPPPKQYKIDSNLVTKVKDKEGQYEKIGIGGGGIIYKGLYNNKPVAIKESHDEKDLATEIKIMAQMHGYPTVLSLEGHVQQPRLQLVMELMSQGSLSYFLKNTINIPSENKMDLDDGYRLWIALPTC